MTSAVSGQIYCLKCKGRTDSLETQEVVLKNGRPAVTGRCVTCGTSAGNGYLFSLVGG